MAMGLGSALDLLALDPPGWGGNLLRGLANSIQIAIGAFGLGILIGTLGAYGKLYGGPIVKDLLAVYTTIVRAVPELILILILYYAATGALNQALLGMGFDFSAGVSWERGVPRSGQRLGLAIEGPEDIFCFFTPLPP